MMLKYTIPPRNKNVLVPKLWKWWEHYMLRIPSYDNARKCDLRELHWMQGQLRNKNKLCHFLHRREGFCLLASVAFGLISQGGVARTWAIDFEVLNLSLIYILIKHSFLFRKYNVYTSIHLDLTHTFFPYVKNLYLVTPFRSSLSFCHSSGLLLYFTSAWT